MNRFIISFALLAILGLGAVKTLNTKVLEPKSFPVGVIAPLSGVYANYGIEIQRGVELAKSTLLEQGINLKVIYEDACIPSKGVPAAKKLLHIDRISALVGNYCIASMVPNVDFFERSKVFAFQSSVVPESLLDKKYVISTYPSIAEEGQKLAEYAYNKLAARSAAILYLQTPWGEGFRESFSDSFKQLGGKIATAQGNPIGVNDFRTELTRIKRSKPDVIFFVHVGTTLGNALRQSQTLGLSQVKLGPDEAEDAEVLAVARDSAEGLTILSPEAKGETTESKEFKSYYWERYSSEPSILSSHSYDATLLAGLALNKCKSNKQCVSKYVRSIRNYKGASGSFSIESNGTTKREFSIKQVKQGQFVLAP